MGIIKKCDNRRRMEEDGNIRGVSPIRLLESLPLDEANVTDADPMDVLSRPFFECGRKKFHPYDWYVNLDIWSFLRNRF